MSIQGHAAPLISVIIPTYNRAYLIGQALDSVESQDCDSYEVLVIDDGSTDNTAETIAARRACNPRIVYAQNERTLGVSGARNTGLDLARGRYIAFLDSDDYWYPGHLAAAVELLEKRIEVDLTFANRLRFDTETGEQVGAEFPSQRLFRKVEGRPLGHNWYLLESGLVEVFLQHNPMPTPTVVLRARSLEDLRFDEQLSLAEDRDFFLRFCMRGGVKVAFRDVAAAHVARHSGNTSIHDYETDINLSHAHIYMLKKVLSSRSLDKRTRQRIHRQIAIERSMIPSYLRWSGRYREAWQSVLAASGILPMRRISFEMLRIAGSWCAHQIDQMRSTREPIGT